MPDDEIDEDGHEEKRKAAGKKASQMGDDIISHELKQEEGQDEVKEGGGLDEAHPEYHYKLLFEGGENKDEVEEKGEAALDEEKKEGEGNVDGLEGPDLLDEMDETQRAVGRRADKFEKDQDAEPPGTASDNGMIKGLKR